MTVLFLKDTVSMQFSKKNKYAFATLNVISFSFDNVYRNNFYSKIILYANTKHYIFHYQAKV